MCVCVCEWTVTSGISPSDIETGEFPVLPEKERV